jgi:hypothetical protein
VRALRESSESLANRSGVGSKAWKSLVSGRRKPASIKARSSGAASALSSPSSSRSSPR